MPRRPRDPEASAVGSHVFDVFRQLRDAADPDATPLIGLDVEACFVAGAELAAPAILRRAGRQLTDEAADVIGVYLLTVMREAVVGLDRPRLEAFERSLAER